MSKLKCIEGIKEAILEIKETILVIFKLELKKKSSLMNFNSERARRKRENSYRKRRIRLLAVSVSFKTNFKWRTSQTKGRNKKYCKRKNINGHIKSE